MVKLLPETGNNNDLSIHVWLIYFQMKNLKKIQKYDSKCTKFIRSNPKLGLLGSSTLVFITQISVNFALVLTGRLDQTNHLVTS